MPEWTGSYIDYKALKKDIKKLKTVAEAKNAKDVDLARKFSNTMLLNVEAKVYILQLSTLLWIESWRKWMHSSTNVSRNLHED